MDVFTACSEGQQLFARKRLVVAEFADDGVDGGGNEGGSACDHDKKCCTIEYDKAKFKLGGFFELIQTIVKLPDS